jgi:probable rRNA maturation factor
MVLAEERAPADAEVSLIFVDEDAITDLNGRFLGGEGPTDVLSFPIDGAAPLPEGEPRARGDVVLCPAVIGDAWRWPLVHGLLHLLGHEHGAAMEARERVHLP